MLCLFRGFTEVSLNQERYEVLMSKVKNFNVVLVQRLHRGVSESREI